MINFNQPILDYSGTPFPGLTLKELALQACSAALPSDNESTATEKYAIGDLGMRIFRDETVTTEDILKLKDRMGKLFASPALVYALFNLLDAANE